MTIADQNFTVYGGDTKKIIVTVTKEDGSPLDLSGSSIKWGFSDIVKTEQSGIVITNPAGGEFTITLSPNDTLTKNGTYNHESIVTDILGNTSTIFVGLITVIKTIF